MPDETEEIEGSGEESQEQPLILGKFRTQDDLIKSYEESQRKITEESQRRAEAERVAAENAKIAQDWANYVQTNTTGQQELTEDDEEYVTGKAARSLINQAVTNAQTTVMNQMASANANIKRALAARKEDGMFRQVAEEFEAALCSIPPMQMADPNYAANTAELIYNSVCGQRARQLSSQMRENPKNRRQYLEELGVGEPDNGTETTSRSISAEDRRILDGLGLKGDARKRTVERYQNSEEE